MNTTQAQAILSQHYQMRQFSCFQSATEMALKLDNIILPNAFPFQNQAQYDLQGFTLFNRPHTLNNRQVTFQLPSYAPPFHSLCIDLAAELSAGRFPVLSLLGGYSNGTKFLHGYVAIEQTQNDFIVISRYSPDAQGRYPFPGKYAPIVDQLSSFLHGCPNVDCLFYA
ncbi:MAG: hypothetical protein AB7O62_08585 [Pirellulales bacterium]